MSDITGVLSVPEQMTGTLSAPVQINGTLTPAITLEGELASPVGITGALYEQAGIVGELTIPATVGVPVYSGEYRFTPGDEAQVIVTEGRMLLNNIMIEAIPNNYGRITWNGSVLTVS